MDVLNIVEFNNYIKRKRPQVIIYDDENNSDYIQGAECRCYSITQPLRMSLTFDNMLIAQNPNIIHLSGKCGTIAFNYVQKISLDSNCLLGDIITLYCQVGKNTTAYTLIIR